MGFIVWSTSQSTSQKVPRCSLSTNSSVRCRWNAVKWKTMKLQLKINRKAIKVLYATFFYDYQQLLINSFTSPFSFC